MKIKWQIESDPSNLSLLVNPLPWRGLMVGFERMSRILMDVKGKKRHPDGDCDDKEDMEKGTTSVSEENEVNEDITKKYDKHHLLCQASLFSTHAVFNSYFYYSLRIL